MEVSESVKIPLLKFLMKRFITLSFLAKHGVYMPLFKAISPYQIISCISGHCKIACLGDRAFDGAWQELKTAGYLKQYRIRTAAGYRYEYDLLEKADLTIPALQNVRMTGEIIKLEYDYARVYTTET